jgi:hypothetical protein
MAKKPNDYMGSGERERILGTGMARNAGKALRQHNETQKSRIDEILGGIKKNRGR